MESYWRLLLTEKYEHEDRDELLDMEGNAMGVAVALDGAPFWRLIEVFHLGAIVRGLPGKRLMEGKDWRLASRPRVVSKIWMT